MIGEQFPYTNFHDLNLDWIIKNIKEQNEYIHNEVPELVRQLVEQTLVDMSMSYDAENTALIFTFAEEDNP